jgi:hypothetical protein
VSFIPAEFLITSPGPNDDDGWDHHAVASIVYLTDSKKKTRRTKRRETHHGDKITNQVTGRSILPRMLVSITNISMLEERNERIEQEPTENDTSIVSSFVHGGFTTSDYDGQPISRSFLHFKSYGNATTTPASDQVYTQLFAEKHYKKYTS